MMIPALCSVFLQKSLNFFEIKLPPASDIFLVGPYSEKNDVICHYHVF